MTDSRLITALQQPQLFNHPVDRFRLIQTHISWVLLTGHFAYKLRKPVNLGFLDFSTPQQRFEDCREELRLNRRFSPELYLELIRIQGTLDHPQLEVADPLQPFDPCALEYAVQMVEFPQSQLLSQQQPLPKPELLALARELAELHAKAPSQLSNSTFGSLTTISAVMLENFTQISPYLNNQSLKSKTRPLPHSKLTDQLRQLRLQTEKTLQQQTPLLTYRHRLGHIRECHGDLHLGNIVLHQGRACPFDCIEFNPRYRWIDPLSDLAFLLMDLQLRKQETLSNLLLNSYLERSLDYHALPLLPLYLAYRAMVRAKITLLSSGNSEQPITPLAIKHYRNYANLAEQALAPKKAQLILMQGRSGSGKSWMSQQLIEQGPWIRLRSDELRKHWHSQQPAAVKRYGPDMNKLTYQRLRELTKTLLESGLRVIIDAAFLRQTFLNSAQKLGIEPRILSCIATEETLEQRIKLRLADQDDPSEASVELTKQQKSSLDPLTPEELTYTLTVDTGCTQQVDECLLRLALV